MIHNSTLALTLLATVVAKQPEQSMAVLRNGGRTMIVRTQMRLRPGLVVEAVHTSSVVLRHERGLEQLGFKAKGAVSPEAASSRPRRQGFQGVRQTGAAQYEIQRSALQSWLSNPAKLARCGRVVPLASGLRLLGIRPRCLWSQLGLRSGDRLVAVNHRAITSPEVALELYTRLRKARFVQLDLLRKGQKISLDYAIR